MPFKRKREFRFQEGNSGALVLAEGFGSIEGFRLIPQIYGKVESRVYSTNEISSSSTSLTADTYLSVLKQRPQLTESSAERIGNDNGFFVELTQSHDVYYIPASEIPKVSNLRRL